MSERGTTLSGILECGNKPLRYSEGMPHGRRLVGLFRLWNVMHPFGPNVPSGECPPDSLSFPSK